MPKQKPMEVITPPNMLKAKIGGSLSKMDSAAIKRAEMALECMSSEFEQWIDEEVTRLEQSWKTAKADLSDREAALSSVYGCSHDLKGLAKTYGYPLVTRFAGSLCKLLEDEEKRAKAPTALVDAHVTTCRVAVREKIKSDDHPVGLALATELETQVASV